MPITKRLYESIIFLLLIQIIFLIASACAAEVPLASIQSVDNKYKLAIAPETMILGNTVRNAYAFPSRGGKYEYLINRKYEYFLADLAFDDHTKSLHKSSFTLYLDGEIVVLPQVVGASDPIKLRVDVKNKSRITFRINDINNYQYFRIVNPRFITGDIAEHQMTTTQASSARQQESPFAVDPNDLDKLAVALRKQVDANATLKERVTKGQVALMTFNLIDISSPSVAANVAEDLSTALIKTNFNLVERGQLDKVLKELKIQDSGIVDPKTAQKIGQQTGCDIILLGSISDRGQFVVINARLMDTASGKSLAAERVEMRKIPISR